MNDQPSKSRRFYRARQSSNGKRCWVKLKGLLFKVQLNNIIGEDGFGYFLPPMTSITSCS